MFLLSPQLSVSLRRIAIITSVSCGGRNFCLITTKLTVFWWNEERRAFYSSPVNVIAKECKATGKTTGKGSFRARSGGHRLTGNATDTRASLPLLLHYWCGRYRQNGTRTYALMLLTSVIRCYLVAILIACCVVRGDFKGGTRTRLFYRYNTCCQSWRYLKN